VLAGVQLVEVEYARRGRPDRFAIDEEGQHLQLAIGLGDQGIAVAPVKGAPGEQAAVAWPLVAQGQKLLAVPGGGNGPALPFPAQLELPD
jgi:hypothetical protein